VTPKRAKSIDWTGIADAHDTYKEDEQLSSAATLALKSHPATTNKIKTSMDACRGHDNIPT
jgi:hypothetical protein